MGGGPLASWWCLVLYTSTPLHPDEFFDGSDEITGRRSRNVNFRLLLVPDRIHPSHVKGVSSISLIHGISSTLKPVIRDRFGDDRGPSRNKFIRSRRSIRGTWQNSLPLSMMIRYGSKIRWRVKIYPTTDGERRRRIKFTTRGSDTDTNSWTEVYAKRINSIEIHFIFHVQRVCYSFFFFSIRILKESEDCFFG